ncbi:Ig-like domain-containing protein [Glaciecola sp. 1036]|uniref:Ig-like domain-containing protein n=1 Tax=Alteromonadaceae TaxID=72275 RepID=UPI003D047B1F
MNNCLFKCITVGLLFSPVSLFAADVLELDDTCVINVLNRTVFAEEDGSFALPNVPSNMGAIRARATCARDDGVVSGQTEYFTVRENQSVNVGEFYIDEQPPTPVSLSLNGIAEPLNLFAIDETSQLTVTATYSDDSVQDVTLASQGTNYTSSNNAIVTVSSDGLITSRSLGFALVTIRKDGVSKVLPINIFSLGDADNDGIPDDIETAYGLDPNDPVDAFEDLDGDGLSTVEEFNLGTDFFLSDTDGDGILDGEEVNAGEDGFETNPLSADTDNDGLSDGIEIIVGSDPTDASDTNFEAALVGLTSTPENVVMTFNGIDTEVSTQVTISGLLIDGTVLDLTSNANTSYTSSDLTVASFGSVPGEIFGGQAGNAVVTVSNSGKSVDINVSVRQFEASAQSAIAIPGYANNVDISGDYAFVASGAEGLTIVDVADRTSPSIVSTLDTAGVAIDIKVVGNTAYIADGENGVVVVDVSDVTNPQLISVADTAGVAQDLAIMLDVLVVADGNQGIEIFDISNSEQLISRSTLGLNGTVRGVAIEQDLLVAVAGSALVTVDISDVSSPISLASLNIGTVQDVVIDNGFAHVAAYSQGYRVVDVRQPMSPTIVGGDRSIVPRDVALTRNFAFYAEQLFPNVVAFVNIFDPLDPIFQGTIDLSSLGDYAGTGIALDASYAYITEERYVVSRDYGVSGDTKLFIAQYRDINDNNGVAPTVSISSPGQGEVVVEGERLTIVADAQDDVAVDQVQFRIDGSVVFVDTSAPYSMVLTVPFSDSGLNIDAIAVDLGGNETTSETINIEIQPDTDGDGLGDDEEANTYLTDLNNPDTDGDRLTDGYEVQIGSNPLSTDSDGDGIEDGDEVDNGTSPTNPDTIKPVVSSTDPEIDAVDIPEANPIVIVFNEALDAKSISNTTVTVSELVDGAPVIAGSVTLSQANTQVTFVPNDLLGDFTTYQVIVAGARDEAGNMMDDYVFAYTTGNFVDTVRPSLLYSNPVNGAQDVPTNTVISALLSEPVDPATVTATSAYVYDYTTGGNVEGVLSMNESNDGIIFVPNAPLTVGGNYLLVLTTNIRDFFGNQMYSTNASFRIGFDDDFMGPEITSMSVEEGQSEVPLNARFNVRFNEPINPLTIKGVKLTDTNFNEIQTTRTLSTDRTLVTLTPTSVLNASTSYQLVINEIQDLGGNLNTSQVVVGFTSGTESDTQTGEYLGSNIPSNSSGVSLNPEIVFSYSEAIDPTTLTPDTYYLYDSGNGKRVPGAITLSEDGTQAIFTANEELLPSRRYYMYAGYSPYFQDIAGNILRANRSINFYTGDASDDIAPEVTTTSISSGASDIPVNARLRILLDERVSSLCLAEITLTDGTNNVPVSISVDNGNRWVTVTANETLAANTDYQLNIEGLCDYSGNEIAPTFISFTTGSDLVDNVAPTLQTRSPATNETDVSVNQSVRLEFNEPLANDSTFQLYDYDANLLVEGEITVDGNSITFTPDSPLRGNTRYRVYIYSQVYDFAGNVRSSGNYYFYTEALADGMAPSVVAISPVEDAIDVSPTSTVVLTFSEPMNTSTINNNNIAFYIDGVVQKPSVSASATGEQVTLSMTKPASSLVSVVITDDVTDLSGNPIAPFISSFTTGSSNSDNSRPSVSRQLPANGSNNWRDINEVLLYLNEPMDAASLEAAVRVSENGILIDDLGQVEVLEDNQTVRFVKDTPFSENARINIFLETNATDLEGNPANFYSGYFNTAPSESDLVGVRPQLQSYYPNYNQSNLPLNPLLILQFNEPMDDTTFTDQTIRLVLSSQDDGGIDEPCIDDDCPIDVASAEIGNAEIGDAIPLNFAYDEQSRQLRITPAESLEVSSTYYLEINGAQIFDTDGDSLVYYYNNYFNTSSDAVIDERPPQVISQSPFMGAENVGTNAQYAVRYDEGVNPLSLPFESGTDRRINIQFSDNNTLVTYTRLGSLAANSAITEEAPSFVDDAGNASVDTQTTFNTGNGSDILRPQFITRNIPVNAIDIPVNTKISASYDESIDPTRAMTSNSYLYERSTGTYLAMQLELDTDGKTVNMIPQEPLEVGVQYDTYFYDLYDLSGNSVSGVYQSFTTGFNADVTAPVLLDQSVEDGQIGLPTNTRIKLVFDETIDTNEQPTISLVDMGGQAIPFNTRYERGNTVLVVTPKTLLPELTDITLTVDGIKDLSNNEIDSPIEINFTTKDQVDIREGAFLGTNMPTNSSDVALNPEITFSYGEPIDSTSIFEDTFYLYDSVTGRRISGSRTLSEDAMSVTFTPDAELEPLRRYYLYAGYSPYLQDYAGNRLTPNRSIYFTTGDSSDNTAPTVTDSNIPEGSLNIPVNARIRVLLDERVSSLCVGDVTLTDGSGEVPISVSIESGNRWLNVIASQELMANTAYQLNVEGLCDYSGNLISPTTLNFITSAEVADTIAPTLQTRIPESNATDVSVNQAIILEFDENIANDSSFQLYDYDANYIVEGNITVEGNRITFTPTDPLRGDTRYRVYIYSQVFDFAGNVRSSGNYYFNTESLVDNVAPAVTAISPATDTVDVNPDSNVVLTFSEPMNASTLNNNNIALYINGEVYRPSVSRSASGEQVTLSVGKPAGSLVSVVITDEVTDLAGNPITPFISTYVTGTNYTDNSRPSVVRQLPTNGSSNWVDVNEVLLYLSEPMDPASLESALRVTEDGMLIDDQGVIEVLADNQTIKFIKDTPFAQNARIGVILESDATDVQGNAVNYYNGYFRTAPEESDLDGTRPYITANAPFNNAGNIPTNVELMVQFNEPMDSNSISTSTVQLYNQDTGQQLSVTAMLNDTNNILSVVPDDLLLADTRYYLFISYLLLDTDGDSLNYNNYLYFTTGEVAEADERQPVIVSASPVDGSTEVGVNPRFGVLYDEPVNLLSLPTETGTDRRINLMLSENDTYLTYERLTAFDAETSITENLPEISDYASNTMAAQSVSFTTASGPDLVRPSLVSTSILNNESQIPTNYNFKVYFSEQIDPTTLVGSNFRLYDYQSGNYEAFTVSIDSSYQSVSIQPVEAPEANGRYQIYVGSVRDFSGNTLSNTRYTTFTLGADEDNQSPVLVDANINADDIVPVNTVLRLEFDGALDPSSLDDVTLIDEFGNAAAINVSFGESRSFIVVRPVNLLSTDTAYQLTLSNVVDIAGNLIDDDLVLDFTTTNTVDFTRDDVVNYSILHNAVNVPRNAIISVKVSDRIDSTTVVTYSAGGSIYLYNRTNGTYPAGQGQVSSDGQTITFVPDALLGENKQYDLYVNYSPYLYDVAGNRLSNSRSLRFTTSDQFDNTPPVVVNTSVPDGSTDLPVNTRLVVTFDEPISPNCVDNISLRNGLNTIDTNNVLSSNGTVITLTPTAILPTASSFNLVAFGLCNYTGSSLNSTIMSFSTSVSDVPDTVAPAFLTITPAQNETDVARDTTIVLEFNEPISSHSNIAVFNGSTQVEGSIQVNGTTLTFTPATDLDANIRYRVDIRSRIFDYANNNPYFGDRYFTTGD